MLRTRDHLRAVPLAAVLLVGAVLLALPALGQFYDPTKETSIYLEPGAASKRGGAPARLSFTLLEEIPLPGPLQSGGPRRIGDRIAVPVAGGWISTPWPPSATPKLLSAAGPAFDPVGEPEWSVGQQGKFRFRALPEGRIVAQKRCRHCRHGWRRLWKLRVAGQTLAPPLVTDRRVFFGSLDNRVYSVRKKNGHRMWATDVGGRVSGGLALWVAAPDGDVPAAAAILVVPDRGTRMLALDPRSGTEVASFELPDPGSKLVGTPLSTPDGRILAATQNYSPSDASLVLLRLDPISPATDEEPSVPYNASSSSGPAPAR